MPAPKPTPPRPREGAEVYQVGGTWGDAINWFDVSRRRVVGWKTPRPVKGDVLLSEMASGKTGRFVFTSVDYAYDPHDMFFADVEFVGYAAGAVSVVVAEARMVLVGRGLSEADVLWVSAETDHGYVQGSWAEWEQNTEDAHVSFTTMHVVGDGWWLMGSGSDGRWIYIEPPVSRPDAATWAGYAMRVKIEENKRRFEQRREMLPTRPHDLPPGVHVLRVESCSAPILRDGSQILAVEFTILASRTHARGARCRWAARSDEAADFVAACSGDFLRWCQETTLLIGKLAGSVVRAEGVQGISAPVPVHFSWSPASDPEQP